MEVQYHIQKTFQNFLPVFYKITKQINFKPENLGFRLVCLGDISNGPSENLLLCTMSDTFVHALGEGEGEMILGDHT